MKVTLASLVACAGLVGATLFPSIASADTLSVNQRIHRQDTRIDQGIGHGSLTHRQSYWLDRRDASIRGQEARDRYLHNGHLTASERYRLEHRLNRTSGVIYREKH